MDYPVIWDDECFLEWFDNGYEMGEDIIYAFTWGRGQEVMLDPKHEKRENPYPNTVPKTSCLKVKDRFFKVNWYQRIDKEYGHGNIFPFQPEEVIIPKDFDQYD